MVRVYCVEGTFYLLVQLVSSSRCDSFVRSASVSDMSYSGYIYARRRMRRSARTARKVARRHWEMAMGRT